MDTPLSVKQVVLENMSCVVCADQPGIVTQCKNGHVVCKSCIMQNRVQGRDDCPSCRVDKGWYRNLSLERIADALDVKISCGIEGCEEAFCVSEIEQHRNRCPHKTFQCPVGCSDCDAYTLENLVPHVLSHRKFVVELTEKLNVINIIISASANWSRTFVYSNKIIVLSSTSISGRVALYAHVLGYRSENSGIYAKIINNDILSSTYVEYSGELQSYDKCALIKPVIMLSTFDLYATDSPDTSEMLLFVTQKVPPHDQIIKKMNNGIRKCNQDPDNVLFSGTTGVEILTITIELTCKR